MTAAPRAAPAADTDQPPHLRLLGRFDVYVGDQPLELAANSQRLIALLALRPAGERRVTVAGTLWPERSESRAGANLRSVMFRLPQSIRAHILATPTKLTLYPAWTSDFAALRASSMAARQDGDVADLDLALLESDLLPDWDEGWLAADRARLHQIRVHLLESRARHELRNGDARIAVEVALAAVQADPLRESAQQLLIEAELELGNRAAALQRFHRFRDELLDAFGIEPSRSLRQLVEFT